MTLDAMDWVWKHSQSKGNTRLALLFVADQVRTPAAEARLSYPDFMRAMNASSKTTIRGALESAEKLGELEVAESGSGRRAPLYRLPKAVGYARTSGPDSVPQDIASGTGSVPQSPEGDPRSGTGSVPQDSRSGTDSDRSGTGSDPLYPLPKEPASGGAGRRDGFTICQPLVQAMTQAGITVSWSMKPADWIEISNIVQRAGVPAMVAFARDTKASARQPIRYATFFLRGGWRGLPPASDAPPAPPRDSPSGRPPHCGHPDCDPITRTRETEDDRGLRTVSRCPDCHPATQKGHAA